MDINKIGKLEGIQTSQTAQTGSFGNVALPSDSVALGASKSETKKPTQVSGGKKEVKADIGKSQLTESAKSTSPVSLIQEDDQGLNLVELKSPSDIKSVADEILGERPLKIAITGYSAPPEGYEGVTTEFMDELIKNIIKYSEELFRCDNIQAKDIIGIITSPTADKGSIDAIGTTIAQQKDMPLLYLTAKDYVEYIDPKKFPDTIDTKEYSKAPKFVFPDGDTYSQATALASNRLLVTGGRNAAVNDFVNAIKNENACLILNNENIANPAWDPKKNRVDNASRYIMEQVQAFWDEKELPYPEIGGFTKEFLEKYSNKVFHLVSAGSVKDKKSLEEGADLAAQFILIGRQHIF